MPRAHAAHALRSPPARPLTVSVHVRHGRSKKEKSKSKAGRFACIHAWRGCIDQGRHLPKQWCAAIYQRRGGVGRGVSAAWMPRLSLHGRTCGVPAARHRLATLQYTNRRCCCCRCSSLSAGPGPQARNKPTGRRAVRRRAGTPRAGDLQDVDLILGLRQRRNGCASFTTPQCRLIQQWRSARPQDPAALHAAIAAHAHADHHLVTSRRCRASSG